MAEDLASVLEDIAKRFRGPQGKDNARFGHLALPKTHLAQEDFLVWFLEAFSPYQNEDGYRLFIVVSEFAKHRAETDHAGLFSDSLAPADPSDLRPILLTFPELITVLKANRAGLSNDESGWKDGSQPKGWNIDKILPARAMLFFNIQPCLPASCALALLGLMKWALDVSKRPSSTLRILTASDSSTVDQPIVRNMVKLHESRPLEFFDISHLEPPAGKPDVQVFEEETFSIDVSNAIRASIMSGQSSASNHIILFFHSDSSAGLLEETLKDAGMDVETKMLDSHGKMPNILHVRKLLSHAQSDDEDNPEDRSLQIIILEPYQRPLTFLQGYRHAHIVLGSGIQIAFDRTTAQLAHALIPLSQDSRQAQVAWSHQPHIETVRVYGSSSLEEFSHGGSRHHRFIEHEEAGGFIAAVFAMSSWGLDPADALGCFQFDTQVYHEMRHRLLSQKIIKPTSGLAMADRMAAIFQAMLPIAKYDYRIAYFVSVPASTPLVLHVKIQLAAILMIGIDTLLLIEGDPSLDELLGTCWGYGRCLAPTGTLWLLLGLMKRLVLEAQEAEEDFGTDRSTADGRVQTTVNEMDAFERNIKQIRKAFTHFGFRLPSADITSENGDLSSDQCVELQYHLLLAYVNQLVATSPVDGDGTQLCHTIVATATEVIGLGCHDIPHLFDIERMRGEEGGRFSYSICEGFARMRSHKLRALHWTGIPSALVALWKLKHAPNETLCEALESLISRP